MSDLHKALRPFLAMYQMHSKHILVYCVYSTYLSDSSWINPPGVWLALEKHIQEVSKSAKLRIYTNANICMPLPPFISELIISVAKGEQLSLLWAVLAFGPFFCISMCLFLLLDDAPHRAEHKNRGLRNACWHFFFQLAHTLPGPQCLLKNKLVTSFRMLEHLCFSFGPSPYSFHFWTPASCSEQVFKSKYGRNKYHSNSAYPAGSP